MGCEDEVAMVKEFQDVELCVWLCSEQSQPPLVVVRKKWTMLTGARTGEGTRLPFGWPFPSLAWPSSQTLQTAPGPESSP